MPVLKPYLKPEEEATLSTMVWEFLELSLNEINNVHQQWSKHAIAMRNEDSRVKPYIPDGAMNSKSFLIQKTLNTFTAKFNGINEITKVKRLGEERTRDTVILNSIIKEDFRTIKINNYDRMETWAKGFHGFTITQVGPHLSRITNTPYLKLISNNYAVWDPYAKSAQGDAFGNGRMRFIGYIEETTFQKVKKYVDFYDNYQEGMERTMATSLSLTDIAQLQEGIDIFNTDQTGDYIEIPNKALKGNSRVYLLHFYTYNEEGKPMHLIISGGRIIKKQILKGETIPFITSDLFPTDSTRRNIISIPHLLSSTQDILESLMFQFTRREAQKNEDIRFYQEDAIPKLEEAYKEGMSGFLPVKIPPKYKDSKISDLVTSLQKPNITPDNASNLIINYLVQNAEEATATSDFDQGILGQNANVSAAAIKDARTGRSQVKSQLSLLYREARTSLVEKWLEVYKENVPATQIYQKVIRYAGANGKKEIIPLKPSDLKRIIREISIEITTEEEERERTMRDLDLNDRIVSYTANSKMIDEEASTRIALEGLGLTKEKVDSMVIESPDTIVAQLENEILVQEGMTLKVIITQNHIKHIEKHTEELSNSSLTEKERKNIEQHIKVHQKAQLFISQNPEVEENIEMRRQMLAGEQQQVGASASATAERGGSGSGLARGPRPTPGGDGSLQRAQV